MKSRRSVTYALFALATLLLGIAAARPRPWSRPPTPPPPPIVDLVPPPPAPVTPPAPVAPPAPPAPPAPVVQQAAPVPQVDVVFALDTTSSMSGLIDGAKRKIWSMVNFISSGQPRPHVRIGLVAYRDVGDAYVTRFYDLSDDLDEVFGHLKAFQAEGGGDTPEHVARALSEAVNKPSWGRGQSVARLVYLVGDAPPHYDYQDGFDIDAIARRAADRGIHINTIRCGEDTQTASAFQHIAMLGKGKFASVEQDGGVAEVKTPYDERLAELNKRLMGTAIGYGRAAGAMAAKVSEATTAPAAAAADRATVAARTGFAVSGEGDLLGKLDKDGKGAGGVNALPRAELPAELAAMAPAEREHVVAAKMKERAEVMAEIKTLAGKREEFSKKAASEGTARRDGFDDSVRSSLKAETRGLVKY